MSFEIPALMREATETDMSLIYDAWIKTMQSAQPFRSVPLKLYQQGMKREIERLLERSTVFLLCSEEDQNQVYSFVVIERATGLNVIHFAYTKSLYWRMGLMKRLLLQIDPDILEAGAVFTCFSPALLSAEWRSMSNLSFADYLKGKYGLIFNPFLKGIA